MCWMLQQKLKNICQKKGENKKEQMFLDSIQVGIYMI